MQHDVLAVATRDLARIKLSPIVHKAVQILRQPAAYGIEHVWACDGYGVRLDAISKIAHLVAADVGSYGPLIVTESATTPPRTVSANWDAGESKLFRRHVRAAAALLFAHLRATAREQGAGDIDEWVKRLLVPPTHSLQPALLVHYPFNTPRPTPRQRLVTHGQAQQKASLHWHRATITVAGLAKVREQLDQGTQRALERLYGADAEWDEIQEEYRAMKASKTSSFTALARVIARETTAQLKNALGIDYLHGQADHIAAHLKKDEKGSYATKDEQALLFLRDLTRRLVRLQEHLHVEQIAEAQTRLLWDGETHFYRDLLCDADVYSRFLPVVYRVSSENLVESHSAQDDQQVLICGLKMKLNGKYQAVNKTSFEYRRSMLEAHAHKPLDEEADQETLLRVALLYSAILLDLGNLDLDPLAYWHERLLPALRGGGAAERAAVFAEIAARLVQERTEDKLRELCRVLRDGLKHTTTKGLGRRDVHLNLSAGIIERDKQRILDAGEVYKDVLGAQARRALAYVAISDAVLSTESICTLRARLAIDDVPYYNAPPGAAQDYKMSYDCADVEALNVLLYTPAASGEARLMMQRAAQSAPTVRIPLEARGLDKQRAAPVPWAVYRFVHALLSYCCLNIVAAHAPHAEKKLFIALWRLHNASERLSRKNDAEDFLAQEGALLAQALGVTYLANTQGLDLSIRDSDAAREARVGNAMASMFCVLPKRFRPRTVTPAAPLRVGLLVWSTRTADQAKRAAGADERDDPRLSTLFGQLLILDYDKEGAIRIQHGPCLLDNYSRTDLYHNPICVLDAIWQAHKTWACSAVLLVTAAPYSAGSGDEDDDRHYLPLDLMRRIAEAHPDLVRLPLYIGGYDAVPLGTLEGESLFIDDVWELTDVARDPSRQVVQVLNVCHARPVRSSSAGALYHHFVAYAAPVGLYDERTTAMIYDRLQRPGPDKQLLTDLMTAFHAARNEQHGRYAHFKLDPYRALIGDDSLRTLAVRSGFARGVGCNYAAVLAEVQKAITHGAEDDQAEMETAGNGGS